MVTEAGLALDAAAIVAAIGDVPDPEIPVVSIVDLGLLHRVDVDDDGVHVELLPTFVGCPALDAIREAVTQKLETLGAHADVRFTYAEPWTSDRITPAGRSKLRRSGFAPPTPSGAVGASPIALERPVHCPWCGSTRTRLENAFGPTQCRSIRYCSSCRQPFEHFKSI